jgi:hypothetical protein
MPPPSSSTSEQCRAPSSLCWPMRALPECGWRSAPPCFTSELCPDIFSPSSSPARQGELDFRCERRSVRAWAASVLRLARARTHLQGATRQTGGSRSPPSGTHFGASWRSRSTASAPRCGRAKVPLARRRHERDPTLHGSCASARLLAGAQAPAFPHLAGRHLRIQPHGLEAELSLDLRCCEVEEEWGGRWKEKSRRSNFGSKGIVASWYALTMAKKQNLFS